MVNEDQKELLQSIKNIPYEGKKVELIVELLELLVERNTHEMEVWKETKDKLKSLKNGAVLD